MLGMPIPSIINAFLWADVLVLLVAGFLAGRRYLQTRAASFAFLAGGLVVLALSTFTGFVASALIEMPVQPLTQESVARSLPFSNAALLVAQVLHPLGIVLLAVGVLKLMGREGGRWQYRITTLSQVRGAQGWRVSPYRD